MKSKQFTLNAFNKNRPEIETNLNNFILKLDKGYSYHVIIRDAKESKTLQQLGALFSLWLEEVSDYTGDSVNHWHRQFKSMFLARIYIKEPIGANQDMWVDLLAAYQGSQSSKLEIHADRISLSWATKEQMSDYMKHIQSYCIENDIAISEPNKDHKQIRELAYR